MQKGMFVKDIKSLPHSGAAVSGVFAIASARRDLTKNGAPYWLLMLQDCTGAIGANIWSPLSVAVQQIPVNSVAWIAGTTKEYQGQTTIAARQYEELANAEWQELAQDLAPASPVDPEALFAELIALCEQEFSYPAWSALMSEILFDPEIKTLLLAAPAARSVHQAYRGGLLEHLLKVARICLALADIYPELDRQALLAGAILHDIGKIREYAAGFAIEITQPGMLFGHSFLGLELLAPFLSRSSLEPALQEHLKHLIISHHGEHEFGAATLPQTPEAFVLHYADNLDAKMGICAAAFGDAEAPFWSERQWTVQRKLLLPRRTPSQESPAAPSGADATGPQEPAQYPLLGCGR